MFFFCGRTIGGSVNETKGVHHYYCPLSERTFNMSSASGEKYDIKKFLNIGSTEEFMWNSLLNLLKNTKCLISSLKSSIENDNLEFSLLIEQSERRVLDRFLELKDNKKNIAGGLVEMEKQNLLKVYSSPDVYRPLKNSLNHDLREVSSETE